MESLPQTALFGIFILGLFTGALSGMLGIGGGLIVVPVLTLVFHFTQKQATGTSLAMMLPPVGLLAVWAYYKNGNVNISAAATLAAAFTIGTLASAYAVTRCNIPDAFLRRFFAFFMLYAAGNMLFRNDKLAWATLKTVAIITAFGAAYLVLRLLGRKWQKQISAAEIFRQQFPSAPSPLSGAGRGQG